MVVTRKNPSVPAPPNSRTASSQPIPRPNTKAHQSPPPKQKQNKKTRPKPKPKSRSSILDRLFLFSLSFFALYALTVCRASQHPQPLVCRALSTYRNTVLEPPLRFVASHPLVSSTYTTHLQPHIHTIQTATAPVVNTAKALDARLRPAAVRVYTKHLRPWFLDAVLPRYTRYVHPVFLRLLQPLEPYGQAVKRNAAVVQRRIHLFNHRVRDVYFEKVHPTYLAVEPHVLAAYAKTRPVLCGAYKKGKGYVVRASDYLSPLVAKGVKEGSVYAEYAWREVARGRRVYVDPHVKQIFDKVGESGSGNTVLKTDESDISSPTVEYIPTPSPTELVQDAPEESSVIILPIPITPPSTPSPSPTPTEVAQDSHPTPFETPLDEAHRALSVAEESVLGHEASLDVAAAAESGPARDVERGVRESLESLENVTATVTPTQAPTPETTSTLTHTVPVNLGVNAQQPVAQEDEDFGIDDFLAEIGVTSSSLVSTESYSSSSSSSTPPSSTPTPNTPTPSEIAAKLAATAEKRKDIVGRHEVWRKDLEVFVEEQLGRVQGEIGGVRGWAVGELGREYEGGAGTEAEGKEGGEGGEDRRYRKVERKEGEDGLGKKALGGVQREGERLVKGLEAYLKAAQGRSGAWKFAPTQTLESSQAEKTQKELVRKEEEAKWNQVLSKVEERFDGVVRGVQGEVHEWYKGVKGREGDVILEACLAVKSLAERAQGDLGMDYAWLDDVTYADWQKYHDLMRTSERFEQTALSIQNGTSATHTLPPDPLVRALDALQADLDDVVLGFRVAVGGVRARARGVYALREEEGGDGDGGFFNIKHEGLVDDVRDLMGGGGVKDKGVAGGIDVRDSQEGKGKEGGEKVDPATLFIGKDRVQVEQAIAGVPLVKHEEL